MLKYFRDVLEIHTQNESSTLLDMENTSFSIKYLRLFIALPTCILAFAASHTQAQVMEINAEGKVLTRAEAGAVIWHDPSAVDGRISGTIEFTDAGISFPVDALTPINGQILIDDMVSGLPMGPSQAPQAYAAKLAHAANVAGVHPHLLEALVWQESRWRANAVSSAGAIGLGQLMPGTARELGVNPYDPQQNLIGSARYLRAQLDRFDQNVELALAAYNAGPGRVQKAGGIPRIRETQNYVAAIKARLAATSAMR